MRVSKDVMLALVAALVMTLVMEEKGLVLMVLLGITEESRVDLVPAVVAAGDWVVVAAGDWVAVVGRRMSARLELAVGMDAGLELEGMVGSGPSRRPPSSELLVSLHSQAGLPSKTRDVLRLRMTLLSRSVCGS